eukprot:Nk52_evm58s1360 gene=Nk52_evmTU58s1360
MAISAMDDDLSSQVEQFANLIKQCVKEDKIDAQCAGDVVSCVNKWDWAKLDEGKLDVLVSLLKAKVNPTPLWRLILTPVDQSGKDSSNTKGETLSKSFWVSECLLKLFYEWITRSRSEEVRVYVLDFFPILIAHCLPSSSSSSSSCSSLSSSASSSSPSLDRVALTSEVEVLLLALYNVLVESGGADGKGIEETIKVPSLQQASIYHLPKAVKEVSLTEKALHTYNTKAYGTVYFGPFPKLQSITPMALCTVLRVITHAYVTRMVNGISLPSRLALLEVLTVVFTCGFEVDEDARRKMVLDKVAGGSSLSSSREEGPEEESVFFRNQCCELVRGLMMQFATKRMFLEIEAVEEMLGFVFMMCHDLKYDVRCRAAYCLNAIHSRAQAEMWCEVLLLTNAMRATALCVGQKADGTKEDEGRASNGNAKGKHLTTANEKDEAIVAGCNGVQPEIGDPQSSSGMGHLLRDPLTVDDFMFG